MEFIKDVLSGKKSFFLQKDIRMMKIPKCPEITVDRVLQQVRGIKEIMKYLPDIPLAGKHYIEREFLFSVVNTVDPDYFRLALAELEARRSVKSNQEAE